MFGLAVKARRRNSEKKTEKDSVQLLIVCLVDFARFVFVLAVRLALVRSARACVSTNTETKKDRGRRRQRHREGAYAGAEEAGP